MRGSSLLDSTRHARSPLSLPRSRIWIQPEDPGHLTQDIVVLFAQSLIAMLGHPVLVRSSHHRASRLVQRTRPGPSRSPFAIAIPHVPCPTIAAAARLIPRCCCCCCHCQSPSLGPLAPCPMKGGISGSRSLRILDVPPSPTRTGATHTHSWPRSSAPRRKMVGPGPRSAGRR